MGGDGSEHTGGQSGGGGHQEDHTGPLIVMFVFASLLLGGVLRDINKRTQFPYTPMLLALGIAMGYFQHWLGDVGHSTSILSGINPHMILLIFIPVLIFESAFNCEWHVFRKSMANILLLAAPGVLFGAILIAGCFKIILLYTQQDMTWPQALTLGCVLSATDPVAVVALLKQLGASVRFNTLVQGQSLLNDGTAMVFFFMFLDISKGGQPSALGVVGSFVRLAIGGALLGIFFGFLMSKWIKSLVRDAVLTANITVVGAFLVFYVAEFTFIKVSGILALVSLGLYMSAVGKRKIHHQIEHSLHSIWSYIQYACETLIFILTGIVVAVEMVVKDSTITFGDWVKMFIFWFLMIGVRLIMVLSLLPILSRCGYGITKKQVVVLIYGGLRGALGLCLALLVGFDKQLPARFRDITVFYMSGMAMLTIIVNGLTCGKVVNYIEMITVPEIKHKLFRSCIKEILHSTQERLEELKNEPDVAHAKWREVEQLAQTKFLAGMQQDRRSRISRESLSEASSQVKQEMRFRFTRTLQSVCWEFYESGEVSEYGVRLMTETCDICNDEVSQKLAYFRVLSSNFTMGNTRLYMYFQDLPLLGPIASKALIDKVYYIYEVCSVFLEACEEAIEKFEHAKTLHESMKQAVLEEAEDNIDLAAQYVAELEQNYPQIIEIVHTTRAATMLVKHKQKKLKEIYQEGIIDEEECKEIQKAIDQRMVAIQEKTFVITEGIKSSQVFTDCPLFSSLSPKQIMSIRSKSVEKNYERGAIILERGQTIKSANIIVSGVVREDYDQFRLNRGIGTVINPYDLTYKRPSNCEAKTESNTRLIQVPQAVINDYLDRFPEFRKKWYKSLFSYSIHFDQGKLFSNDFSPKELRRYIEAAEIQFLQPGQNLEVQCGAFMFTGKAQSEHKQYTKGNFISQRVNIRIVEKCAIILFVPIVGIRSKQDRLSAINAN